MAGEPAFFEIGVQDLERGRAFYAALLGWAFDATGGGHRITTPGIGGGMHGGDRGAAPWVFFRVDDMDAALERLESLGGSVEVLHEGETETAESIARQGRFRWCRDDQGSAFGLHQPPA
jgi:predicted enzyme related to lactoylglutathione lyase